MSRQRQCDVLGDVLLENRGRYRCVGVLRSTFLYMDAERNSSSLTPLTVEFQIAFTRLAPGS